jgi:hypothetical protein
LLRCLLAQRCGGSLLRTLHHGLALRRLRIAGRDPDHRTARRGRDRGFETRAPLLGSRLALRKTLDRVLAAGRRTRHRDADDVALDDEIVGSTQHHQMFDIVAPQEDELPLPVEIVDIDDAEPRLSPAAAILAGQIEPLSADAPEHDGEKSEKRSNDRKRDHILDDG